MGEPGTSHLGTRQGRLTDKKQCRKHCFSLTLLLPSACPFDRLEGFLLAFIAPQPEQIARVSFAVDQANSGIPATGDRRRSSRS